MNAAESNAAQSNTAQSNTAQSNTAESPGQVRIERDGPLAWLIFDHEQRRNAMTIDMWRSVPDLCTELGSDRTVRVVILRGAGEQAFVAGADISQFETQRTSVSGDGYEEATGAAYAAIERLPKPTLACVHGFCIGGGLAISLMADVRYFADDVKWALPPAKLGIGYSADGIQKLVDLLGPSVTKEIIYTAELYDAETAVRWGLANHVRPKADLDAHVRSQAELMATRAPLSQYAAKLAVARDGAVDDVIKSCFSSDDYAEGVAAFMAKRQPVFKGS